MTPETKARLQIDQKLEQAGWVIQDMKHLNLGAAVGVAVREYPTDTGPADYVLFVNRNAVGVIEAKKDSAGENITVVEDQTQRYATANLKWRKDNTPLRFLFEATGQIIRYTDNANPAPRSREIFHFFKPETLAAWLAQTETLRRRLAEQMPALPERNLRDCQISAVTGLEKSLALNKPRALVHMATGAGKTFTAINKQSVADGVNVGYDVYEIETEITQKGAELKAKEWVDHRDRATRKKRWGETEEDITYSGKELDKSVVNVSQIRQVIQAMKTAVETQIFPARKETPKILIFAKTDSHADDIINIVREVYGQGNAFCKKVTCRAEEDSDSILSSFRNDYHPRIAVTVDMIATGTDVKPLEVLLFMRDVRSKGYYEQMKGRGVRSLDGDSLKRVSNSADGAKTRFVLIDAVGVEKSLKTESRPLEKKPGVALKDLLQGVAMGSRDDDAVLSLANRLVRLAKQLDDKAQARIEKISGGIPVGELGKGLIAALDPDAIAQAALATAKVKGITRSEDTLLPEEIEAARAERVAAACAPFDNPDLRDELEAARREREQLIDHINLDEVTFSGFSEQAEVQAKAVIQNFADYIRQHKDEIAALDFFYQQPYQRRALTFDMIENLHEHLSKPPLMLTTERLWSAYARVQASAVKGTDRKRQLTDLVSLVRFALGLDGELKPFADEVDKRFQAWIFRHNAQRGTAFTPAQTEWLRLMKDHIASSCSISRDDFDYAELADKGGLQKAWGLFGKELDTLMNEMNVELVA